MVKYLFRLKKPHFGLYELMKRNKSERKFCSHSVPFFLNVKRFVQSVSNFSDFQF